jgi:D-proline reductase (dithiol) PrdB
MTPTDGVDFTEVERAYLRKFLPDFEWTRFEAPTRSAPLTKQITEARVALVSTSGAYLPGSQQPFDTRSELGDDSFRIIPGDAPREAIALAHAGYDTRRAAKDVDCVFPLGLLREFEARGELGAVAPRHMAFMGYVPRTARLLGEIAPAAAAVLAEDEVDLVVLVPT